MWRPISGYRRLALAATGPICAALLACAGKSLRHEEGGEAGDGGDPSPGSGGQPGKGGAPASGQGGTIGQGGSVGKGGSKSTGGSAGKATGGTSGTNPGGSSGTISGGTSGGGSSGTGTCTPCTPTSCSTLPIPTRTINDFENLLVDPSAPNAGIYGANDANGMPKPEWWLGYFSGSFVYPVVPPSCSNEPVPMYSLEHDDTNGVLRVTGSVGTYAGFGIWLGPCIVDMSYFSGVSFRIGGKLGDGELVTFRVHTNANTAPDACLVGKGACSGSATGGCSPAGQTLALPEKPEVFRVRFEELTGGSPESRVDPAEVVALTWSFTWGDGAVPYDVDVTLDDVVLFE